MIEKIKDAITFFSGLSAYVGEMICFVRRMLHFVQGKIFNG
ncbi:hypothetical protein [Massilibacteroides vaginae]|nr:hypothetical protein [Massilibacteroides vaginae]